MIEPEMVFADLDKITDLAERLIKYVVNQVLENNLNELEYLEKNKEKEIINKLKKITSEEFKKVDYNEIIKILEKNKENFVFDDIK